MARNRTLVVVGVIVALMLLLGIASLGGAFGGASFDPPVHPASAGGEARPATGSSDPMPSPSATAAPHSALAQLATLAVKGKSPLTGYARVGDFGRAWLDVDHNGCDTRDDILARDLKEPVLEGRCKVVSGILAEPYTGRVIDFLRGVKTSALVQIDHLVPLANAWQTGAQQLSQVERQQLANDPLELLAVDGSANEQKGDGDAATWLPAQKGFRCTYVAAQIAVKAKYRLWVTPPERAAMMRVLAKCPDQTAASH